MDHVSDYHHSLSVRYLHYIKCKMEILHYQFPPAVNYPLTVILCFFESLCNGKNLKTVKHTIHLSHHCLLA